MRESEAEKAEDGKTSARGFAALDEARGAGSDKVVKRFNQRGLDVLSIAAGRGRKPTYTSQTADALSSRHRPATRQGGRVGDERSLAQQMTNRQVV